MCLNYLSFYVCTQLNTGQHGNQFIGNDLNVEKAWLQGVTGCNVTVTVVDDGKFILCKTFTSIMIMRPLICQ